MKLKLETKNIFPKPIISPDAITADDIDYLHENFFKDQIDAFIPSHKEEKDNKNNFSITKFLKNIIKI